MTLKTFWYELGRHDWYYQMSDDPRVYRNGDAQRRVLKNNAKQSPEHQKLFDEYEKYMFSGPPFGTEEKPKPECPADT